MNEQITEEIVILQNALVLSFSYLKLKLDSWKYARLFISTLNMPQIKQLNIQLHNFGKAHLPRINRYALCDSGHMKRPEIYIRAP